MTDIDLPAIEAERDRIRTTYLTTGREEFRARAASHRAAECGRRAHGQVLPGGARVPADEIVGNRDYEGSNHFFFDIGNGNLLAFFDFPGLDLGPYAEVLGGLHHLAISVEPGQWERLKHNLDEAGVEYLEESGTSIYFRDPDGARIELIADPLGEMYGLKVL